MLARFTWLEALQTLTFTYSATILLILGVGLVFYFIPNAKTRFRDVWVGAVLTGVLWRLAFDGFSWYIGRNARLTFIHGSIAAVVVFLLWIYVSSVILMYGVEFTAAYARLRRRRPDEMPAAPTPAYESCSRCRRALLGDHARLRRGGDRHRPRRRTRRSGSRCPSCATRRSPRTSAASGSGWRGRRRARSIPTASPSPTIARSTRLRCPAARSGSIAACCTRPPTNRRSPACSRTRSRTSPSATPRTS